MTSKFAPQTIKYTKLDGTRTERTVIFISKPSDNCLALDVTTDPPEKVKALEEMLVRHRAEMETLDPKFRSFIPESIELD